MNMTTLRFHPYSPISNMPLLALLVVMISLLSWCGLQIDAHIADENDLLEWSQALLLALACGVHARRAWRAPRASVSFALHLGLAILMYGFLLRELDIDNFGEHVLWTWIERGFRFTELLMWIAYLVFMVPRSAALFSNRATIFAMPVMTLTLVGGLFMLAGWPFDKAVFHGLSHAINELGEEVLELNAYLILLFAALADSSAGLHLRSAVARRRPGV